MRKQIGWFFLIFSLNKGLLFAQEAASQPIDISASQVEYTTKDGQDLTRFSGNVTFTAPKYKITADQVEFYKGGERLAAEGNINVFYQDKEKGEQGEATCGHLEFNRTEGYLVVTVSPFIKITKTATKEDPTNQQIEITTQKLELWTQKNLALATGKVKIVQPDLTATSEKAEFFLLEKKVILTQSPQIKRGQNSFSGEKITLFADTGKLIIEGQVRGQVTSLEPKEEKKNVPQSPKP